MLIYLDNAATTFKKPQQVLNKVTECLTEYGANPGRGGHRLAIRAANEVYAVRETVAVFFNISDPLRIIFTSNATEALNLAIKGVLKSGDHVITTSMEHNSVLRPLTALKTTGVSTTAIYADSDGFVDPENISAAIKPNTKLVAVNHASNLTGSIQPISQIGEICRKNRILFLVDASQTAGVLPIDVKKMNIDLLATSGHKSLFGIMGTGLLYVGEGVDLTELKQGGTGSLSEEITQPLLLPDRYESGTLNLPGIVSLGSGIEFIKNVTPEEIHHREQRLAKILFEGLSEIKGLTIHGSKSLQQRLPLFPVNLKDTDASEFAFELDNSYHICTRAGLHCAPLAHKTVGTQKTGAVRFSIGYFNTEDEIYRTLKAVKEISVL